MDNLVIVGISGQAGAGKTTLAQRICGNRVMRRVAFDKDVIDFDHMTLAAPLKELLTIKTNIQGKKSKDRRLYEIHRVLVDLFGSPLFGAPNYKDLVSLVYELEAANEGKPEKHHRRFLQKTADLLRSNDELIFVNNLKKRINMKKAEIDSVCDALADDGLIYTRCIVVSDIRYEYEAKAIIEMGGKIVRLAASDDVRNDRIKGRGEKGLSKKAAAHTSENQANISASDIDLTINTDEFNIDEVATIFQEFIIEELV